MTRNSQHTNAQRRELPGQSLSNLGSLARSACAYPMLVIVDFVLAEGPT